MIQLIENKNDYFVYSLLISNFIINLTSESEKLNKKKIEKDAVVFILNIVLGNNYHLSYLESGQPVLINSEFKISISHSAKRITVQLSKKINPGVDTEILREKLILVKSKFLNPQEILNYERDKELMLLCLHWSAKEAIYKSAGIAGLSFSNQIRIDQIEFISSKKGNITATLMLPNGHLTYCLCFVLPENDECIVFVDEISMLQSSRIKA